MIPEMKKILGEIDKIAKSNELSDRAAATASVARDIYVRMIAGPDDRMTCEETANFAYKAAKAFIDRSAAFREEALAKAGLSEPSGSADHTAPTASEENEAAVA